MPPQQNRNKDRQTEVNFAKEENNISHIVYTQMSDHIWNLYLVLLVSFAKTSYGLCPQNTITEGFVVEEEKEVPFIVWCCFPQKSHIISIFNKVKLCFLPLFSCLVTSLFLSSYFSHSYLFLIKEVHLSLLLCFYLIFHLEDLTLLFCWTRTFNWKEFWWQ